MAFYKKYLKFIPVQLIPFGIISALWIVLFLWSVRSTQSENSWIKSSLEWLSPFAFLAGTLVLVLSTVLFLLSNRTSFNIQTKKSIILFCIMLISAVFRLILIPSTERLYYDEHCYQQLAIGIAEEGRLRLTTYAVMSDGEYICKNGQYPHWPAGWPVMLGIYWKVFDYNRGVLPFLNVFLSLLTILLVAKISWILWPKSNAWLYAAIIYGCLPDNIIWSVTTASETFSAFLVTLLILLSIYFAKTGLHVFEYMLVGSLAMAILTRNELIVLIPICLLIIIRLGSIRSAKNIIWPGIMLIIILLPQSLHFGAAVNTYEHDLSFETSVFSFQYLYVNLISLLEHLRQEPVSMSILCLSLISLLKIKTEKIIFPLILLILSIVFISSFHFGARYTYPGGGRFMIIWLPALCILGGYSLSLIHSQMSKYVKGNLHNYFGIVLIIFALYWSITYASKNDQSTMIPRNDISFLRNNIRNIPPKSVIICINPSVIIAEGVSSISPFYIMENETIQNDLQSKYHDCIYFYSCPSLLPINSNKRANELVEQFMATFRMTIIDEQHDQDGRRVFYQLEF